MASAFGQTVDSGITRSSPDARKRPLRHELRDGGEPEDLGRLFCDLAPQLLEPTNGRDNDEHAEKAAGEDCFVPAGEGQVEVRVRLLPPAVQRFCATVELKE